MSFRDRSAQSIADLVEMGLIGADEAQRLTPVGERYAVAVTAEIASLIEGPPETDPIARQFLPDIRELTVLPHERADPIGDEAHSPVKGLVHRYPDRVLLKIVGVCPVYCRFCFRREMVGPGSEGTLDASEIDAALAYIAATPSIFEVILTGGDPFVLSARRAGEITERLSAIPHVKVLRWHTRVPIVAPSRVTAAFVDAIAAAGAQVYVAIHANHPREFTGEARAAISLLKRAGVGLVSQSVLLRGVNDDVETLEALMRAFLEAGVKPYYLHHGDLAPGTSHFRTSLDHGQALMAALRQRLSGLAMPTYVLDVPGGSGKVPVGPSHRTDRDHILDLAGLPVRYGDGDF